MNKIWAPWRSKYIQKCPKTHQKKGCVLCQILKNNKQKKYLIFKSKHSFVILNIFPYNNGHLMICPNKHTSELSNLKDCEALDLFKSLNTAKKILSAALKPQGYNIGINIAKSAGAGITKHLHIHLVPRWDGDTNFMPVLNNTRVISQSLEELAKQLKKYARSKTN